MNPKGSRITFTLDTVWDAYHLAQKIRKVWLKVKRNCPEIQFAPFTISSHPSTEKNRISNGKRYLFQLV